MNYSVNKTNQKQIKDVALIQNEGWRMLPCKLAERLTNGRFKRYDYIQKISHKITQAIDRGNSRIVLSVPPRHGKSFLTSQWVPFWFLSLNPDKNVILTSYEAEFAAHWGRAVRNLILEYGHEVGLELTKDSTAADRWNLKEGGGMITAGVGGPITGRGGHLIIIDDPIKNWQEAMSETYRQKAIDWFNSTLYTRLEPGASLIVIMTRWHERDLAGYLLKEHSDKCTEIKMPALAEENDLMGRPMGAALNPERYDVEALENIKRAIGSRMWNSLYQQRPAAEEGNIIKRHWVRYYSKAPAIKEYEQIIQSWDLTFTGKSTSDFVVGQVWGKIGADKYLLDLDRGQYGMTETIQAILAMSRKWPDSNLKLIENKANGPAVEDMLKKTLRGIVLWEPKGDKVSRLNAVAPQFESGNVYFPEPSMYSWVLPALEEIFSFPNAPHDDIPDSMTMALLRLDEYGGVGRLKVILR